MTGEVTLRGRVLPIGGLKEKVLAAHRGGIKTVLVPEENEKDIREIPANVLRTVNLVLVDHMDQVLRRALVLHDPDAFLRKPEVPPRTRHWAKRSRSRPRPRPTWWLTDLGLTRRTAVVIRPLLLDPRGRNDES